MNRQSFLKCLLGIAASPKIISEIDFEPPLVSKLGATTSLFNDLIFVVPDYMPQLIEKYGNTSWQSFFGMLIPSGWINTQDEPDPKGAPIYARCKSEGPCACTGACKKIIGYDTDPDKVKAYHEGIARRNKLLKERITSFRGQITNEPGDGKVRIWTWEAPTQVKDAEFEIIQPKKLT